MANWLQIWNLMQGRLSILCAALFLNEIYPAMKFQVDTFLSYATLRWKIKYEK
jgi:hypothetical protein